MTSNSLKNNPPKKDILIVVDMQKDFCQGGSLEVPDSESLLEPLNTAIKAADSVGLIIVFTRDWHPVKHESFVGFGGQWPPHCIAETDGAAFHEKLYIPERTILISKGVSPNGMGYSPYESKEMRDLIETSAKTVYVTGIALEYCVRETCLDTLKYGVSTIAIKDLVRSISTDQYQVKSIWNELKHNGCVVQKSFLK